ncbi:sulfatase [Synoicihabitans lomoniglobus]|uniref:Sulfatase n=2 Tax=Synoicihabitans lomoniglobus TaxID=2909285 RepID=A0AAE9ZVW9_9BACT|nr:sulfatase [Opitutaceae bacterium LMO-M01]
MTGDYLRFVGRVMLMFFGSVCAAFAAVTSSDRPNVILIVADDMGFGDLGAYGHPTFRTPQLDRMAAEGQRWTQFYAGANVCTPSRAAMLTGRWPVRNGMTSNRRRVLTAHAAGGLPPEEITIAEVLREAGYATGAIGKWHLGHLPRYLPTRQGFDEFSGTPYSNDELVAKPWRRAFQRRDYWNTSLFYEPRSEYWDIPWMRNEITVERPVDQRTLTSRSTDDALDFIGRRGEQPFFLYLAYHMPHVPLFVSEEFAGRSEAGIYGDALAELDDGVGRIMTTLREQGMAQNTLVVFTSDNGPWTVFGSHGGSAGSLRGDKGSTWDGGNRVPALFWWPGTVAPAVVRDLGAGVDLFTTIARIAGAPVPEDRQIDGVDLTPVLRTAASGGRGFMPFFRGTTVWAVRDTRFKMHLATQLGFGLETPRMEHEPPLLFDLLDDPSESRDVAASHPEAVARLREELDAFLDHLTHGPDQLVEQLPES